MLSTYAFAILACFGAIFGTNADSPSCDSEIYCKGPLLQTVQLAKIFPDQKTFVDMKLKYTPSEVLSNFEKLMRETKKKPNRKQVKEFVMENFESGNEMEDWEAPDFDPNPPFLETITVPEYRDFIHDLVKLWSNFTRIIKPEVFQQPEKYSMIPVPNGFVIPGGRFSEFYYWDSYWIQKGLLASNMHQTVRGMIENFLYMVEKYGFVPNGGRVYYLNRSQPPLLSLMVHEYMKVTNDLPWLKKNLHLLQKEMKYWLRTQTLSFNFGGSKHQMAHYYVDSGSPRPESFSEDVTTCAKRKIKSQIKRCYSDLKSGAETGWDFSSRWTITPDGGYGNLSFINTRRIIPVDLNSFLAQAFGLVSQFSAMAGDQPSSEYWMRQHTSWKKSISEVLYNKTEGIWFDLDLKLMKHRRGFYPSNIAPLWSNLVDEPETYGDLAVAYLRRMNVLDLPGGTPTSLLNSGEQWDAPNAWPPLQSLIILGLKRSGSAEAEKVSETLAKRWIDNNLVIYNRTGFMYEKYDALQAGVIGGGGEYTIQTGFGWTNGEIFELVEEFYSNSQKE